MDGSTPEYGMVAGTIGVAGTLLGTVLGGVLMYKLDLRADRMKRERDQEARAKAAREAHEADRLIGSVQG